MLQPSFAPSRSESHLLVEWMYVASTRRERSLVKIWLWKASLASSEYHVSKGK